MFDPYEIAHLDKKETSLPFELWFYSAGKAGQSRSKKHDCVKFIASANDVDITVGFLNGSFTTYKTARKKLEKFGYLSELKEFAERIKTVIQMHWNNEITDRELLIAASSAAEKG